MASEDEPPPIELGINLETVATVIDHARALQSIDADAEPYDDEEPETRDPEAERAALAAFIDELTEEEQATLIALAWVGRGDYDAEEWAEARRLARERGAGRDTAEYLLSMDMLGDLLAEGLAAFGIAEEEIER
ncbi:MAG: DUF3775 domain-containing protein [Rhodovarius sp.]|nr:DUF3775 domain-containing protein [Rhodovarius sp.]MCX7933028.1 DUF3775 domain-containing protein [Rhodovarius sp.]MDW8314256.1 DUF3775 domain-containing protein [Rhodovarius sp.]